MEYILLQNQEIFCIITKSLSQHSIIEAQTSDEIKPLEIFENNTVAFDDMLLSKEARNIDVFNKIATEYY